MSSIPLFSIIMPVLNRVGFIGRALDSLVEPARQIGMECLVMDGGSVDGTQAVAARYPFVRLRSAPDRGLYDALNQGIDQSRGQFIGFLNSDDRYGPSALPLAAAAFDAAPEAQSVCGGAREVRVTDAGEMEEIRVWNGMATKSLTWAVACRGAPIINARFFRGDWLRTGHSPDAKSGLRFLLRYRIAADRAFLIAALRSGMTTTVIEPVIYDYTIHDGSLTFRPNGRVGLACLKEYRQIATEILADPSVPSGLHHEALAWFSRDCALSIREILLSGQFKAATRLAMSAAQVYPAWPFRAILDRLGPRPEA